MSPPPPTPAQSVARFVAGVDALGWSEPERVRYVRTFLEDGIDALERAENARLDFLAHCAQLAGDNMQDARLHVTDERLAALEDPDSDASLEGFFVELALILALELAVVATATVAIPALIAFVAAAARTRAVRKITAQAGVGVGLERALGQQRATSASLEALTTAMNDKRDALFDVAREKAWYTVPVTDASRALTQAEHEYAVALAAHEESETLVKAVNAAIEAAAGAVPPSLSSVQLREMLDGALADTTVGRVAEQVATDDLVRELLATASDAAPKPSPLFQTSSLVGRFLESNERTRAEAGYEWSRLRSHVRKLPDAALVGSEIAHGLLLLLFTDPPALGGQGPGAVAPDADAIVRGMEVVLWLAWLRQKQALGQRFVTDVPLPTIGTPAKGSVWEGMFVTSARGVGAGSAAAVFGDGFLYPGLLALADGHGRYLYDQFAREFFVNHPDAAPVELEFDAARYDGVDALPDGRERTERLAEMKLLAIVFFQTLEADPTTIGSSGDPLVDRTRETLRTLLGLEPEHDVVAAFLASQPPTSEPSGAAPPQPSEPPDPAEVLLAALAAERVARDAATKLATMVTDLDLLIGRAPTTPSDESAGLVERFAAEDAKFAIEQQKQAVSDQYDTFLEQAAGQTELVDEVNAEYYARIEALLAWPPPAPQLPSPTP